jgi:glycerophosphoryl diester phosphodiesterase
MTTTTTPLGRTRFAQTNRLLHERLAAHHPLIVVHRGSGGGSIAENTGPAFRAAVRQGADMVETDVIRSTDGDYFLFHNGYEKMHFGLERDIRKLSTAELRALRYGWHVEPGAGDYGLEPLETILTGFDDVLFNVDRSWWFWPDLLERMSAYGVAEKIVLKSPVAAEHLDALEASPAPFPYMPIVRSRAEIEAVLARDEINTVAIEVLAATADDELSDPGLIDELHARGLLVQLNAINLGNRVPLFLGWDDEVSLAEGPENGWGRLISHGADLVQTDWPALLRAHRDGSRA